MKLVVLLAALGSLCLASCGGESKGAGDEDPEGRSPGGGDPGDDDDLAASCGEGCEATLAAQCSNGPDTQELCEEDCRRFATGPCKAEYGALSECAEGKTLTCSSIGLPSVPGCEAEQTEFALCL
jgi:hypothetical protein